MPVFIDARVPVVFAPAATASRGDALLLEADAEAPAGLPVARFRLCQPEHGEGCACCAPRSAAAVALRELFLARVQGRVPWFGRVVAAVCGEGEAAVRAALAEDGFAAGRYRLG